MLRIIFFVSLIIFSTTTCLAKNENIISIGKELCKQNILKIPESPFALLISCEYAQGNYLGVIYQDTMGPGFGGWYVSERFWQESAWSDDVKTFIWSPSGKYLFVSTSEYYGEGGIYQLDLVNKKFKKISPNLELFGREFVITHIDFEKNILFYTRRYELSKEDGLTEFVVDRKELKIELPPTKPYPNFN